MARRILFAALFTITTVLFVEVAHAEIFAAGPVYGGNLAELTGAVVTVRVFNAGLAPVTINLTQILTNTNSLIALTSNTCLSPPNAALGAARYCAFTGVSPGNFAFSCRLNATGIDTNLRGVCEVRGTSGRILSVEPLQR